LPFVCHSGGSSRPTVGLSGIFSEDLKERFPTCLRDRQACLPAGALHFPKVGALGTGMTTFLVRAEISGQSLIDS